MINLREMCNEDVRVDGTGSRLCPKVEFSITCVGLLDNMSINIRRIIAKVHFQIQVKCGHTRQK